MSLTFIYLFNFNPPMNFEYVYMNEYWQGRNFIFSFLNFLRSVLLNNRNATFDLSYEIIKRVEED